MGRLVRRVFVAEKLSPGRLLDDSLLWRVSAGAHAAVSRWASGSRLLSLDRVGAVGPADVDLQPAGAGTTPPGTTPPGTPAEDSLAAGLGARLRETPAEWVGGGLVGRYVRRAARGVQESALSGGGWVRPAGAFAAAAGLTAALSSAFGPLAVTLLVVGAFMLIVGPRLVHCPPRAGGGGRIALLPAAAGLGVAAGWGPPPAVGVAAGGLALLAAALFALYRPEGLLLILAAFPWLDYGARRSLGGLGGAWDELLLLASLAALLWAALVVRRTRLPRIPLLLPLALAVVAAVGSVAVREVPGEVAVFALRVTFQPLIFFFLGYLLPKDRGWIKATVAVFLLASLLMAGHGLFQYATGAPMPQSWVDARETAIETRAYSIVDNPNGLGAFLLPGALLAGSLALSRVSRRQRLLAAAVAVVLLAGIAVTFSRGAWLGLIAGVVALLLLGYRRLIPGTVGAGLLSLFFMPAAFLDRLTFAFSPEYINKSLAAGRLYIWDAALRRAVEHPWFGVGLGTFGGTSAYLFDYSRLWVDSFYIQLALEGGFILLAAFLWLLFRAGKGVVASYLRTARDADPFLQAVAAGVFGGFVAVAAANLTASVWETLVVGAAFWFLTGVAWSLPAVPDSPLPRAGELSDEPPVPA